MRPRVIKTILNKDLRDAIRDARVLVAVLVPFAIGIFYHLTFDDDAIVPQALVLITDHGTSQLPELIQAVAGDAVIVTFREAPSIEELERAIGNDEADLGLIIPSGFDAAVARGNQPYLSVIRSPNSSFGGDYVIAALEPALRIMAQQQPPAAIALTNAPTIAEDRSIIDTIGIRTWAVLAAIVMMIAMISTLAIPVILAEETEKRTLDALVMIASYAEVIVAKALIGVVYVAVMVPLLLAITRLRPAEIATFVIGVAALSVTLIGMGLFLAGFFKNANQLNTWSGIILAPIIAPAFIVGLGAPDYIDRLARLFPTGGATRVLLDSASNDALFSDNLFSLAVICIWGVLAYGLLFLQLSRRQA